MIFIKAATRDINIANIQKVRAAHLVPNRLGTKEEAIDKAPEITVKIPVHIPEPALLLKYRGAVNGIMIPIRIDKAPSVVCTIPIK